MPTTLDVRSFILVCLTWSCIIGHGVFLQVALSTNLRESLGVRSILNIGLAFTTLAVLANDILTDRCWRRIAVSIVTQDPAVSGARLRAANFCWFVSLKQLCHCKLSTLEMRAAVSNMALRWGTVVAIPLVQLSVDVDPLMTYPNGGPDRASLTANIRAWMIPFPVIAHLSASGIFRVRWYSSQRHYLWHIDRQEPPSSLSTISGESPRGQCPGVLQ